MKKLILFLISVMTCTQLFAAPIKKAVFFGDSLSDNGNLYLYSDHIIPSPPYVHGRFTNGPVWSDKVAAYLKGKNITSKNYAIGGTTVIVPDFLDGNSENVPAHLGEEIQKYLNETTDERGQVLFSIWMGANDYLDEMQQDPEVLTDNVVNEIVANIRMLINAGGEHFLVMDIPDLAKTVRGRNSPEIAPRFAKLSQLHHEKMSAAIALLQTQHPTVHFYFVNVYDLFNDMLVSPEKYNQKYQVNIQNTTESCWLGGFMLKKDRMTLQNNSTPALLHSALTSPTISEVYRVTQLQAQGQSACAAPDEYIFWDEIHPTRVIHGIFAAIIEEKLAPHLG